MRTHRWIESKQRTMGVIWLAAALATGGTAAPTFGASEVVASTEETASAPYIVVLKDDAARLSNEEGSAPLTAEVVADLLAPLGVEARFVYTHALKGFAASLNDEQLKSLAADERVAYVKPDRVARPVKPEARAKARKPGSAEGDSTAMPSADSDDATLSQGFDGPQLDSVQQPAPSWGLDRIDQRYRPVDGYYTYDRTGQGVHVYVIASGVYPHPDFAARLGNGYNAMPTGDATTDDVGVGTILAGIVGGSTYGVAKNVTLHSVRVFDDAWSQYESVLIAGVDWVTANAVHPAVAVVAITDTFSIATDTAVQNSINSGVSYAVTAEWEDHAGPFDACWMSPSRIPAAVTVAGTNSDDLMQWGYGPCVDLAAPGKCVVSTRAGGGTTTTSCGPVDNLVDPAGAAHVGGAMALYLESNPFATPADVAAALISASTKDVIGNAAAFGSPNRLLFNLNLGTLLLVTKAGAGSGTVTSTPAGISCGTTCAAYYAPGTLVTLVATPAAGSTFAGWSGSGCSGTGSCTVTLDAAKDVTATFTLLPTTWHFANTENCYDLIAASCYSRLWKPACPSRPVQGKVCTSVGATCFSIMSSVYLEEYECMAN